MSKVDIIIPVFNGSKYIAEAVESALGQTYIEKEIFVVDDGSTDNTKQVLSKYEDKIRYIYQENRGVAAARNAGIQAGNGEYIAFLDSDDIWFPDKLEKQIAVLEKNQLAGFVYCDNYFVDGEGTRLKDYPYRMPFIKGNILPDLFCGYFIITSSLIMRRSCFEWVGYFDDLLKVGEDYAFFLKLAFAFPAEVIEEKLWQRRVTKTSLSHKDFILDWQNDILTLNNFVKKHKFFSEIYRPYISKRLSEYHYDLAYHSRKVGRYGLALKNSLLSLNYEFSKRGCKNLMLSFLRKASKNYCYV
ncbi:MAG: glycosyltransferase family A protein [Candidatus Omnitrophota bacterium]